MEIGIFLLLITIVRPHFGFAEVSTDPSLPNNAAQAAGFNGFTVALYIVGLWLLMTGVRNYRKSTNPQYRAFKAEDIHDSPPHSRSDF